MLVAPAIALASLLLLMLLSVPTLFLVRRGVVVFGERLLRLPVALSIKGVRRLPKKAKVALAFTASFGAFCFIVVAAFTFGLLVSVLLEVGAGNLVYFLYALPTFILFEVIFGFSGVKRKALWRVRKMVQEDSLPIDFARAAVVRLMVLKIIKSGSASVVPVAVMASVWMGVYFSIFHETGMHPEASKTASLAAILAIASCYLVAWLAGNLIFHAIGKAAPLLRAVEALESASADSRQSVGQGDPLGHRRAALLSAVRDVERLLWSLDSRGPKGVANSFAVLLRAGSAHVQSFCGSRDSLSRDLPESMDLTIRWMRLLLLGAARDDVYGRAADLWQTFDGDGRPIVQSPRKRFARLKEVGLVVGRSVEPAGRAAQVVVQLALFGAIAALVVLGKIDLAEMVKKVLQ
ncbi:hypothetical protein JMF97_06720 [Micromonospora fiedleri]|uniref:Type II secretion system protein GspF domain-containing protein n=1 Tax=Micromonospora fiedleri TaxID=1157498 RepID=A0ABS1UHN2_9ACTN|nr:hypothetical protein [Micromonospora fiedleri]MBL6275851.1 hypothetical protein [Micromonospora fiedleri]